MSPATTETAGRLEIAIQGTIQGAVGLYGKLAQRRIRWQPWLGLGWLESTAVSSVAAAGVRAWVRAALRCASKRAEALVVAYVMR